VSTEMMTSWPVLLSLSGRGKRHAWVWMMSFAASKGELEGCSRVSGGGRHPALNAFIKIGISVSTKQI